MSRFKTVIEAHKEVNATSAEPTAKTKRAKKSASPKPAPKKVGRPPGKRTNPDYQSVTTFLHKQTYLDAQKALIDQQRGFGDLVDELLQDWLARQ